ncbi:MarR family winged helix-turn-helix transcriptional regulator [Zoogloea sp. LCSB751]|uniref:MarR family winged helix-turn-helix transcriptional regulator n=1 Tax=Zoogloea sp. LCSB751 TaxID=1965277 RepID=UPI0009A53BCA|nr:MarR family transcriptional regulator [Zoogloea sp. LCSB751]
MPNTANTPQSPPYTVENYRQEESIGFLLHQAKLRLTQALDERIGDLDITTAQWTVLKQIALRNGETASTLCKCMGCDTGSMTRMIDRLEEKALIRRERSTTDRRVVLLHVTDTGKALLPLLVPRVVDMLNQALRDFTPEEIVLTKQLISRIVTNLDKRND